MSARLITRFELGIATVLIIWFGCTTVPHAWRSLNTDFTNYYITARLVREHSATSRIYELIWFQREKDHMEVDQPFSAMPPLTPFSTLFVYPLTHFKPLAAKQLWLLINAALLIACMALLIKITDLPRSRILLLVAASYPLQRNLLNGQYYVLLLFVLTLALYLRLQKFYGSSGVALAIAIGLKLFPILFVLYLLRKRDWRTLVGTVIGLLGVAAISLATFGWQLHRLYILEILPRGLRGESTGPYNLTSSSFTVLFHRLFLYEPSLNPHPALNAPWLFPFLLPLAELAVIAPMLWFTRSRAQTSDHIALEWSAVLTVCLTLSPLPASYHFVLLFLPTAVLLKSVLAETSRWKLIALILLFLAIGFPYWPGNSLGGWHPILHVPRLYAMLLLYALILLQLHTSTDGETDATRNNLLWISAFATLTAVSIVFGIHSQQRVDPTYANRLPLRPDALLLEYPEQTPAGLAYIAMERTGYAAYPSSPQPSRHDQLSQAVHSDQRWIEQVSAASQIVGPSDVIADAENPVLSPDGRYLAYSREDHGHLTLWLHSLTTVTPDHPLTPPALDILEATFTPANDMIVSAETYGDRPSLFRLSQNGTITPLNILGSRYPAASPDGHYLAYSQWSRGGWNLRLLNLATGQTTYLTDAPCNVVDLDWSSDSKTILYASDCNRAIGQTALYARPISR